MKNEATGDGVIKNAGGDAHEYLGHFRKGDVIKRGHNVGPPKISVDPGPRMGGKVKPQFNAETNPIAATRQANRANVAGAKASGGNVGQVRAENRAAMAGAKTQRKARNAAGMQATDRVALKAARGNARIENKATAAAPGVAKHAAVQEAKTGLQSAVGGVRSARQALRSSIRAGDVAGAGSAFGALQTAKGAKKTARQGVRAARGASYA